MADRRIFKTNDVSLSIDDISVTEHRSEIDSMHVTRVFIVYFYRVNFNFIQKMILIDIYNKTTLLQIYDISGITSIVHPEINTITKLYLITANASINANNIEPTTSQF